MWALQALVLGNPLLVPEAEPRLFSMNEAGNALGAVRGGGREEVGHGSQHFGDGYHIQGGDLPPNLT